jgi:hypothetical protein
MHTTLRKSLANVAIALTAVSALAAAPAQAQTAASRYSPPAGFAYACPATSGANATCTGLTRTDLTRTASPASTAPPAGFSPSNIRQAYGLPFATGGTGQTVAVVGAYDYAHAEADLNAYRSGYGIAACTTANGCFQKVNVMASGDTMPPSAGWDVADAQAMDMISAVCPNCHILLVQAETTGIADAYGLGAAEDKAVSLGAKFIVNPWARSEISNETSSYDAYFNHPGVVMTASGGDGGFSGTVSYPAASPYVVAVGGTTLTADSSSSRGYDESAWTGTQSGCSAYEAAKPAWQTDTACAGRSVNDVAAVADPGESIVYYDSDYNTAGWGNGGGTSYAAAIIAAAFALAGPPAPGSNPAAYLYTHPSALWDMTTGSTGTCQLTVLCDAGAGWDGPTGVGTPHAIAAFHTSGARPVTVTATDGTTWVFATSTDGSIAANSLPSGGSTWSGFTSLGGTWPAYPAALATSDGSVWVFAIDGNGVGGSLYANTLASGSSTWSGWTDIGNPGVGLIGTPTAVQDKSSEIRVFARSVSTGNVWEVDLPSGSTTWSAFSKLGGNVPDGVSAVVGGGGFMYLMSVGNNSALYYDKLPPGGSWSGWTKIGGIVTGAPAIMQDASGNDHVFVREAGDGALLTSVLPSGSSTWPDLSSLGGSMLSDPVTWAGGGGTNWAWAITEAGSMDYDKEGSSWSGLTSIGSGFTGVPGVVQDKNGTYHLFGRTSNGSLAVAYLLSGTSNWSAFTDLGGSIAAT